MREVKIEAIVNSRSGPGHEEGIQNTLTEAFKAAGLDARISLAQTGHEVIALAQQAVRGDAEAIVAGGGDGTISSIAAVVLESGKLLGVLPFGTMNHFAKDLGIPLELAAAVETISAGHVTKVDVGEVNGHVFINNSSLGLYPSVVRAREKQQELGWGKWPAYVWAAFAVLRRYPFLNVRIGVDGEGLRSRTPFVFIGNNEYEMESLSVGTRSCLDKGELSLYMTNRTGRLGLIRLALRALLGGLHQEKDFVSLCAKEIWIETRHQHMRVALDGEVIRIAPPLHYRVRPGALPVLAPPNANRQDT
jgi:diacylglycerol kinase family enzyme